MSKLSKTPCGDCPFRKDSIAGWIGGFENAEAIIKVAVSELPFSCHTRSGDETNLYDISEPQCTGRLLFASRNAKSFRNPTLEKMRLELKNTTTTENIMNLPEMKTHHAKGETNQ